MAEILVAIFNVLVALALPLAALVWLLVKRRTLVWPCILGALTFFVTQVVKACPPGGHGPSGEVAGPWPRTGAPPKTARGKRLLWLLLAILLHGFVDGLLGILNLAGAGDWGVMLFIALSAAGMLAYTLFVIRKEASHEAAQTSP